MEECKPSYYTVIPANVRYDKNLKLLSILLYGEITALCNKFAYCYASNKYFSELFDVSTRTISDCINELKDNGYISIEMIYKQDSKEVEKRIIKLAESKADIQKIEKKQTKKFVKPTVSEVQDYCYERNNSVDANKFVNYYESKDWYIGKNKMKDWKAAIRTWEGNQDSKPKQFTFAGRF